MNNSNKIAIYPGTFDPITNGHIDVIERAAQIFDKVYVVVAINSKKATLFNEDERTFLAQESLKNITNVEVVRSHTLTVEFAKSVGANTILRGIRAVTDFEYEFQIALMNRKLEPNIHTLFLLPNEKYTYLNSSIIRELARYHQDISEFVPEIVAEQITKKFVWDLI